MPSFLAQWPKSRNYLMDTIVLSYGDKRQAY
jgi:hypothetical protein